MLGPWDWARRCCFWLVSAVSLTACATDIADTFEVSPFLREQITGDTWRACAARQYQAYARSRVRADRDWTEATVWAAHGRAALDGRLPSPHHGSDSCDCGGAFAWSQILDARRGKPDASDVQKRFNEMSAACTGSR